jgi:hypothetical protein
MTMKRHTTLLAVLGTVSLCGACAASSQPSGLDRAVSRSVASVTGYKVVGPPYRSGVSGPLTVDLNQQASVQLATLIGTLPPGRGPHCIEPASMFTGSRFR